LLKGLFIRLTDLFNILAATSPLVRGVEQNQEHRMFLDDDSVKPTKLPKAGEQSNTFREPWRNLLVKELLKFFLCHDRAIRFREPEEEFRTGKFLPDKTILLSCSLGVCCGCYIKSLLK
jgi:hypothetical protein